LSLEFILYYNIKTTFSLYNSVKDILKLAGGDTNVFSAHSEEHLPQQLWPKEYLQFGCKGELFCHTLWPVAREVLLIYTLYTGSYVTTLQFSATELIDFLLNCLELKV